MQKLFKNKKRGLGICISFLLKSKNRLSKVENFRVMKRHVIKYVFFDYIHHFDQKQQVFMSFKKISTCIKYGDFKIFYANFHLILCNHLDNWILKNMKDFTNITQVYFFAIIFLFNLIKKQCKTKPGSTQNEVSFSKD